MISALMAAILTTAVVTPFHSQAASPIKIIIDGKELVTDQAPLITGGRTFVPLRGIFEALDASVLWNNSTKTVTAYKDGTTVVLKLGANKATINSQTVYLDAPAVSKNGRTLVPLRFVSESLGQNVEWQPASSRVVISTANGGNPTQNDVGSAPYVGVRTSGQTGTGSDVTVSFARPANPANISGYRIFIVKEANASSFTYEKALTVNASNYTLVAAVNSDPSVNLTAQTRDADGNTLVAGASYRAFVLSVGRTGGYALSASSSAFTLSGLSVAAVSNLALRDAGDYGDGRDLSVSFTRPGNDANISGYRVFIVKTSNASSFSLSAANATSSSYYTAVGKSGSSTLNVTLNAGSRDTSGDLIRNGVSYTAFVLSVSNQSLYANKLSSPSAALTLNTVNTAPVVNWLNDVSDYGDGRDLQINFTRSADESKVAYYRIFVVKSGNAGSFSLNSANSVSSGRYYDVGKTGNSSISTILPSNMKDVQGSAVTTGVSYRVFVMAVSNNPSLYPNLLSAPSSLLTLNNNAITAVSNLQVADTADYGDGRDLRVSFNRAANESGVSGYRVFVVKAGDAGSFNVNLAGSLSSSYYTSVSKTGGNLSLNLNSYTRSVDGAAVTKGQSYRVYVLTMGIGGNNVLSSPSASITLTDNLTIGAASHLQVSDRGDAGNASDLNVSFNRAANETNISSYRIMVVKASEASSFTLAKANKVTSSYYKQVSPVGRDISINLDNGQRTVNGDIIQNGTSYQVFVLSVGGSGYSGSNALSAASPAITLTNNLTLLPATEVTAAVNADNPDRLDVSFKKSETENLIAEYRILVVPAERGTFTQSEASAVEKRGYLSTGKDGDTVRGTATVDITGADLQAGAGYRVYVLAVSNGSTHAPDVLSAPSEPVTLPAATTADPSTAQGQEQSPATSGSVPAAPADNTL
ncbi:copper amine oxidase N-terminal domain-containing protein [Paenibacillus yonginensis]|nr:copper amine oxidase N-terminal domain-containing protein [Paenibacillus yonginensis]